jgi:cyclopropane fatty-acyl-phospholipid synthase-like methyltransferase
MKRGDLAFFDFLFERFAAGDAEVRLAFGRHVHWGYWADPRTADGSTADFAQAAESMARLVCDLARVQDGSLVLDVGCGFGGTLASLNDRFQDLRLVGANVDGRQLVSARTVVLPQRNNRLHVVQCDGSALPFAAGTFDQVLAIQSIFHFGRAEFLHEARRVLRPGGRLVVSDFVPPPALRTMARVGSRVVKPFMSAWTANADAGWTVDDYREVAPRCGLRLTSEDDVTDNTQPTYPVLRRVVRDEGSWPTRAVAAAAAWVADAGMVRYAVLAFEAV